VVLLACSVLLTAACGNVDAGGGVLLVNEDGTLDYSELDGSIRVDGSSTVFPISEAVAEEFSKVSDVRVNVGFSGTGGGFERFCRGDIDVADASRPIKQDEIEACAEAGIDEIVELQVATDALTVMVNPQNDFVGCLTVDQLHAIFKEGGAERWSDIDPAWPDDKIHRYFPGTDSGTFDYFVDSIIEGVDEDASHTGEGTFSEDDNILLQGIEGDDNGIGYVGFAYFQEAGQDLKSVAIDGGDGCVEPSLETARDGSYEPLSRPVFVYTAEHYLRERPHVLGLLAFYVHHTQTLSAEVGYVPLTDAQLTDQQRKIEPFLPKPSQAATQ
jgi:phosphate transport system substrate-binding protein